MSAEGILNIQGSVEFRRIFDCDIETLWKFLVEEKYRRQWLCGGIVAEVEGGVIEFKFDPEDLGHKRPETIAEGQYKADFTGQVLTYEPPTKLAFTWPGASESKYSLITITLENKAGGTGLHLKHERLHEPDNLTGAAAGWHVHFDQLDSCVSDVAPPNFWHLHEELENAYRQKLSTL